MADTVRLVTAAIWRQRLIALIAAHSLGLGVALLVLPTPILRFFGFPTVGSSFFPCQSGLFLIILGALYARALAEPALVQVLVLSKSFAVAFLIVWAIRSDLPVLWLSAAGDGGMLAAILLVLAWHRWSAPVEVERPLRPRG